MSPACRTPNAAIPPTHPRQPRPRPPPATDHRAAPGPRDRQRRTTPSHNAPQPTATSPARPRPVACPPSHRSPAHSTGGFCTIRRTATACRRRVAPLMLQFPPFARGNHAPARHQRRIIGPRPAHAAANAGPHPATTRPTNRNLARRATPGRLPAQPPLTGPLNGGFCTIRRTATACRRRVAPLMLQFPHSPGQERLPHRRQPRRRPWQAHPTPHRAQPPPHPRSGSTPRPQPRASQPPATNGATFRATPTIQSERNQINSVRLYCHKPILNALECIHEPRRWGHRSPLHPRNC